MRPGFTFLFIAAMTLCSLRAAEGQTLLDRLERTLTQPVDPGEPPIPSPPTTVAGRPSLGVTVDPVTDAVARQRGLAVRRGALITAVVQGSPADTAGLPLGGVIVAVDGERIDSSKQLVEAIRVANTERPIEISYYEGARLFRKSVRLAPAVGEFRPRTPTRTDDGFSSRRDPRSERRFTPRGALDALGDRPLLGRVGQIIDELVEPAGAEAPLALPPRNVDEVTILREQVASLQQQLDLLQKRLVEVERQLAADNQPSE